MTRGAFKVRKIGSFLCILALVGCTALYRNHGYVPSDDDLAGVIVGVDTRDSVAESIGSPSAGGVLDTSGYYYVQSRVRHYAYQEPQVVERQVVAITFDDAGVVRNIERFGLENGQVVPLARRVTDTGLATNNFLKDLLSSLGNFSASDVIN